MSIDTLYQIAYYLQIVSVAIPVSTYFARIRKNRLRHLHFIGALVSVSFVVEITVFILLRVREIETIPVIHNIFFIIQFCLLSLFYYEVLLSKNSKTNVYFILFHCVISSPGVISSPVLFNLPKNMSIYHGAMRVLGSFVFIIYAAFYYRKIFWASENERIKSVALLWINGGILIYFVMGVGAFIMRDQSITGVPLDTIKGVWIVHNIISVFKNLAFAKGLFDGTQTTSQK